MACLEASHSSLQTQRLDRPCALQTCPQPDVCVAGSNIRKPLYARGGLAKPSIRNLTRCLVSNERPAPLEQIVARKFAGRPRCGNCDDVTADRAAFKYQPQAQLSSYGSSLQQGRPDVSTSFLTASQGDLGPFEDAAMPQLSGAGVVGALFAVCANPGIALAEGAAGGGAASVVGAVEQAAAAPDAAPAWLQPAILAAPLVLYGGFYWYRENVNPRLSPFDYVTILLIVLAVSNLVLAFFFKIRLF